MARERPTAHAPKTAALPAIASRAPATSGPARAPIPSAIPDATFAAVSSSGVSTTSGSSDDSAGRLRAIDAADSVANA